MVAILNSDLDSDRRALTLTEVILPPLHFEEQTDSDRVLLPTVLMQLLVLEQMDLPGYRLVQSFVAN